MEINDRPNESNKIIKSDDVDVVGRMSWSILGNKTRVGASRATNDFKQSAVRSEMTDVFQKFSGFCDFDLSVWAVVRLMRNSEHLFEDDAAHPLGKAKDITTNVCDVTAFQSTMLDIERRCGSSRSWRCKEID